MPYSTYEHKIDSNLEAFIQLLLILAPFIIAIIYCMD